MDTWLCNGTKTFEVRKNDRNFRAVSPYEVLYVVWANLPQIAALFVLTESTLFIPILVALYRKRLLPVILHVLMAEQKAQRFKRSI